MAPLSTRPRSRTRRSVVLLASVLLPLPVLGGCGGGDGDDDRAAVPRDIAPLPPAETAGNGTLNWAVDALPGTLNAFQADADDATERVAGAVLPALFTLDERGRPQRDADFLTSAEVVQREPRQVVVYKLNPKAAWSDGRALGAPDFEAQWKALRGQDSAYWTARNAGYDRIDRVERGADAHEVKVTFAKPYADWAALFTPLYPKSVMGNGNAFNDGARNDLKIVAGPFKVGARDNKEGTLTLERNPKWWGDRARLDKLVLRAVPRGERGDALAKGLLDLADITPTDAARIDLANKPPKKDTAASKGKPALDDQPRDAATAGLRKVTVRKSLEPAYTQLALNGSTGPLADERVRKAVARAIDRKTLAESVLTPLGLPAEPLGSHVLLAGQDGYQDNSGAIGGKDPQAARSLLADAGWREKGAGRGTKASGKPADAAGKDGAGKKEDPKSDRDGGKAAPAAPPRIKDGKKLTLRFVVPDGAGTEPLRGVADRIARQLAAIGVGTKIMKVDGGSYFKDHIAAGDYDMALYSWPATAFPATDARPVFAKPQPAADGSLLVEQNYTRVGTDQIDQLFDQASTELDADASRDLIARADARIWAAAGSIPLYQRPELTGVRKTVVNAGAFGLATPRYQDLGFRGQAAG
ncbi:ABC transporter family substrate-binding protein [Streptomyces netropsis]|uniref:ABC transporter family substrate-binding protein n=1 Tax=Streptomyces netropsis TaxID=55404 RepID=UPI0037A6549E